VGGVWLIFLGWLLFSAAGSEYTELQLRQALNRVRVSQLMTEDVKAIPPETLLSEADHDYFLRFPYGGYPVTRGNQVLGILTLKQIRDIPREEWDKKNAEQAMLPLPDGSALFPDQTVSKALENFRRTSMGRLPVIQDGQLVGILSQSDVVRWLNAHPEVESDSEV
jgi:CBS domain-containing protein